MGKKGDNIKVLFEKARGGDVKELPSLSRAFTNWLRLSFQEERSQPLDAQLLEKFLDNLIELIQIIEKIENIYWKTKAVEILSRLMETIYTTRNLEPTVKHLESILHDFAGTPGDQAIVKRLGDIANLLAEPSRQAAVESPPANKRKLSVIRKKRGGCTTTTTGTKGRTKTIDNFMFNIIKDVIETKIEDTIKKEIKKMYDELEPEIKDKTMIDIIRDRISPEIKDKIKKILENHKDKIKIESIEDPQKKETEDVIKDKIEEMVEEKSLFTFNEKCGEKCPNCRDGTCGKRSSHRGNHICDNDKCRHTWA